MQNYRFRELHEAKLMGIYGGFRGLGAVVRKRGREQI